MIPGKYYFASDLAKEHDFSRASIHVKLCDLAEKGYVDWRKTDIIYKHRDGRTIARVQYRRTGKAIPISPGRLQPQM